MSNNVLVTPVIVADKMLEYMDNELEIAGKINRQYEKEFKGGKGSTVIVTKPPKFIAQDGPAITTTQAINQGKVPVVVDQWKTVAIELGGTDMALNRAAFANWSETYLKPAASILANTVEQKIYGNYSQIANFVGTPGTAANAFDYIAQVAEILTYNACPRSDRHLAVTPKVRRTLGGGLTSLYNPQGPLGTVLTEGKLPPVAGMQLFEAMNAPTHTVGANGTTGIVNGANQVGSVLVTDTWDSSAGALAQGDVFTIASVYMVNPVTKATIGTLQPFICTQAITATGTNMSINIYPPIITSGPFQTVSASPADNGVITMKTGTASTAYGQSIGFHRNALGLVMVPVPPLEGGVESTTRTYKNYSVTISKGADIMGYRQIWRADILFGTVVYYPELACRLTQ